MTDPDAPHPTNLVEIDMAVFDGPYEGWLRRKTAAEWMRFWGNHRRAQVAIRRARSGEEGVAFRGSDGTVYHARLAQAA